MLQHSGGSNEITREVKVGQVGTAPIRRQLNAALEKQRTAIPFDEEHNRQEWPSRTTGRVRRDRSLCYLPAEYHPPLLELLFTLSHIGFPPSFTTFILIATALEAVLSNFFETVTLDKSFLENNRMPLRT